MIKACRDRSRCRVYPLKIREFLNQLYNFERIVLGKNGDGIVGVHPAGQTINQPSGEHGFEYGVGTGAVDYARARVETSFDRVAPDYILTEAVDGGCRDLVEMLLCGGQVGSLFRAQSLRKRKRHDFRNLAAQQGRYIASNPKR